MTIVDHALFGSLALQVERIANLLEEIVATGRQDRTRTETECRHALDAEFERLSLECRRASEQFARADSHMLHRSRYGYTDSPSDAERERHNQLEERAGRAEDALSGFVRLRPEYGDRYAALMRALAAEVLA